MYKKFALVVGTVALLGMLVISRSNAQVISGDMVGTVLDKTGAAIAGANVEATNVNTGVKTQTKAGANGEYRFSNLPVGAYNVSGSAPSFSTTTINNFPH